MNSLDLNNVCPIIPAAGWGTINNGRHSKLIEPINGTPMILRAIQMMQNAGFAIPIVAINHRYGQQIREALKEVKCHYVVQPERTGSADAVLRALPLVSQEHVLVRYPDMPLWCEETLIKLATAHIIEGSTMSLISVESNNLKYGRIFHKTDGTISEILEPDEITDVQLPHATTCNPSLFCFKAQWLRETIPTIPPCSKGDGFPDELHLPRLAAIACREGQKMIEIPLANKNEALGVNTQEDYQHILRLVGDTT